MAKAKAAAWVVAYFMSAPIFWGFEQASYRAYIAASYGARVLLRRCIMAGPPRWRTLQMAKWLVLIAMRITKAHQRNIAAFELLHTNTMAAILAAR